MKRLSLLMLLFFSPVALFANEPVYVQADAAEYDHKTGIVNYHGNVKVDQGTTKLRAQKATTRSDKHNQLTEAIAFGNDTDRAFYTTLPDPNKPALEAFAITIKYFPQKKQIVLEGNAEVQQGRDSYKAPHIVYHIESEHVISKASDQGRTTIVIHPEDHRDSTA